MKKSDLTNECGIHHFPENSHAPKLIGYRLVGGGLFLFGIFSGLETDTIDKRTRQIIYGVFSAVSLIGNVLLAFIPMHDLTDQNEDTDEEKNPKKEMSQLQVLSKQFRLSLFSFTYFASQNAKILVGSKLYFHVFDDCLQYNIRKLKPAYHYLGQHRRNFNLLSFIKLAILVKTTKSYNFSRSFSTFNNTTYVVTGNIVYLHGFGIKLLVWCLFDSNF